MSNSGWNWASNEGLYNTPSWKKLRREVLKNERLCRMCKSMNLRTPADMVDHIIPVTKDNWEEVFLDYDNCQPLCYSCHSFKTNRDKWHDNCTIKRVDMDELLSL